MVLKCFFFLSLFLRHICCATALCSTYSAYNGNHNTLKLVQNHHGKKKNSTRETVHIFTRRIQAHIWVSLKLVFQFYYCWRAFFLLRFQEICLSFAIFPFPLATNLVWGIFFIFHILYLVCGWLYDATPFLSIPNHSCFDTSNARAKMRRKQKKKLKQKPTWKRRSTQMQEKQQKKKQRL